MLRGIFFAPLWLLMQKYLIILLMAVHIMGNTELGQLLKLPSLLTHYRMHHINSKVGFMEFLKEHYNGDDGTTSDDTEDEKLPFNNIHSNCFTVIYAQSPNHIVLPQPLIADEIKVGDRLQFVFQGKHVLGILQPPRLA